VNSKLFWIGVVLAATIGSATPAFAQSWKPSKGIEFIVGAGSGGGNDRTARVVQKILQERALIPTPMVVVNKPGAGGVIAQDYLNTHPGDAHYLMITNPALLTNPLTGVGAAKYTDITPIAQLFTEYVMLLVKADGALVSGKDIIERLRKDPGALSIAVSPGPGAGTHIATALVMKAAGIDSRMLRVVSYKSAGEALAAVLGGHVDLMPSTPLNVLTQMQAGKIRVVGVTAPARLGGAFAQVPTWREQGIDAVFGNWRGVVGPKGLSAAQLAYWDDVFSKLNATEEWKSEVRNGLWDVTYLNSRDSRKFLDQEYAQLKRILTDLGLAN
jgi:putative tricarboxylic transport membrane protein